MAVSPFVFLSKLSPLFSCPFRGFSAFCLSCLSPRLSLSAYSLFSVVLAVFLQHVRESALKLAEARRKAMHNLHFVMTNLRSLLDVSVSL